MMFFRKKKTKLANSNSNIAITNYLTDGLLVFNSENKLTLLNPRAEMLFEVLEGRVLGKSILELARFERLSPLVSLLGGEIKPMEKTELQIKENLILEITSTPIARDGERINTLIVTHDITREKLSDKMKTEFVTLAAHQLRTPTSGIKWSLGGVLDGSYGELNESQKEILTKAYKTNDKVIELVRDLLDVAQIEEGKYLRNLVLTSIEDVIKTVLESRKQEIMNKKLNVEFQREDVQKIMLDIEKMEIVFKNILDNAIRYTSIGGKIIITLNRKEKEREVEIHIKDNGIGIPEYEQDRVFTKFFRGSNVMRIDTEGTGLGLYISRNIIEAHGGRVWFESKEKQGTTVHVTIPIKERFGEFLTGKFY
ncbi:GHKL domain-containing protein [Patescibacteria group bacterium]|nr:GHKL domain-containing protein [Patescibacteria group bacterium]